MNEALKHKFMASSPGIVARVVNELVNGLVIRVVYTISKIQPILMRLFAAYCNSIRRNPCRISPNSLKN